jgi:transcriptional regulator with XRE-family HTH domain
MSGPSPMPSAIGARVRRIRRRRGMSLDVAAGLAGISKSYLSMLETGERRFERRGLVEDLAAVLGCSVADLTGGPYRGTDRASTEALATLPPVSLALHDTTLDDAPDMPARPVTELAQWAATANEHSAFCRYSLAGRDLGALLGELHVHVATGTSEIRRAALTALVESCAVACGTARTLGNPALAVTAAQRGADAARLLDNRALRAFAAMALVGALSRMGARHRAAGVAGEALTLVEGEANPTAADTSAAEAYGLLHLASAQMAAKDQRSADVDAHLGQAAEVARWTGERNHLWFSFGPANVRAWSMSVAVELGSGATAAEQLDKAPGNVTELYAADRRAALHFDLARGYAQAEGARDWPRSAISTRPTGSRRNACGQTPSPANFSPS